MLKGRAETLCGVPKVSAGLMIQHCLYSIICLMTKELIIFRGISLQFYKLMKKEVGIRPKVKVKKGAVISSWESRSKSK